MSRGDTIFRWRCYRLLFVQPSGLLFPMVFPLSYILVNASLRGQQCTEVYSYVPMLCVVGRQYTPIPIGNYQLFFTKQQIVSCAA